MSLDWELISNLSAYFAGCGLLALIALNGIKKIKEIQKEK